MKKALKIVGISLALVVVLSMAGFFIWAMNPSKARGVALSALQSDEMVRVTETQDYILFEPVAEKATVGFIFYPGGHSLGGVASAWFAAKHPEIRAVVFWASYPADDTLLSRDIKMLSIYGTEDGGLDEGRKIELYKKFQPKDTVFYEIKGANHGQFADYGPQPGDKPARISQAEQFEITARVTADFLRQWKE